MKRKLNDLYEGEGQTDSDCLGLYERILVADYRGKKTTFILQSSYTPADAKKKVDEGFNLDPGTYTMEYQHEGEKFMLNTDEHLISCINRWRSAIKVSALKIPFKMNVLVDK